MANMLHGQIALQQQGPHTYHVGFSMEWALGPILLGGCIGAVIHTAAELHFNSTLAAQKQPDVHTIHFEFLKPCTTQPSTIKITDLKVGKGSSFIQLDLYQENDRKCTAFATSIDFTVPVGPTAATEFTFFPPLHPPPDFRRIEAQQPDENWIPSTAYGDLLPLLKHLTFLYPIDSQPHPGTIDYWCVFNRPETISPAHLVIMSDISPSASDTLLRNEGVFDAHRLYKLIEQSADDAPGKTATVPYSLQAAAESDVFDVTLNLDLQFKRRVPRKEMAWMFTRVTTRTLEGGRMDMDLDICDEELRPVMLARQTMLVVDAGRRFKKNASEKGGAPKL